MARAMKESGIAWIGKIPTTWNLQRGKNILTLLERPVKDNDDVITCFRDGEVTLRSNRREDGFTFSDKEIGYQGIEVGDLVVHGMDGFAGAIGISDSRGKATPVLNVLDSTQCKRYLKYYMRCAAFCGLFLSLSTGIRVRSCDTNWNKLKEIMYLVPPIDEQRKIAYFIDAKCSRIDAVIEQTRASIEEYKKLKQAVITQAVTKGILPNRPMKDSGITWVGEIPSEWRISKFKWEARVVANLVDPEHYEDYQQIAPDSIEPASGRIIVHRTVKDANVISWNQLFQKGQILYSKIRPALNKVAIAPYDGLCSADMYPIETNHNVRFFLYLMLSDYFVSQVDLITRDRVKMPKINQDELSRIFLIIPDLKEQISIAEYLDEKCTELDKLLLSKEKSVKELESYKKSLIYEYVTGKKEVV